MRRPCKGVIERELHLTQQETVVAAAIQLPIEPKFKPDPGYPDFLTISAPPPARHHSLLHPFIMKSGCHDVSPHQGFLTSKGRFVGREEALQIALAAGQPLIDHPSRHATKLFSEDLW